MIIGLQGTIPKGFVKEQKKLKIDGQIDTIQTTA